ncbi:MAG: hypothetical protein JWN09_814 [Microbacteriaceae bacterium]|nr:hypothetical protein [Microbacteriaceae bacterium]
MTDPRPRPQYGEYATPQDQAKAMGAAIPTRGQVTPQSPPPLAVPSRAKGAPRRWDLVLTLALLAYGPVNVVTGFFQFANLATVLNQVYTSMGIGTFPPSSLATSLGVVINVSNAVLYVITAFVTARLLRSGRLAFYVPIAGAAAAWIVSGVCIGILMFGDPTFTGYLSGTR